MHDDWLANILLWQQYRWKLGIHVLIEFLLAVCDVRKRRRAWSPITIIAGHVAKATSLLKSEKTTSWIQQSDHIDNSSSIECGGEI